jgi:hypothetical protein
MSSAPRHICSPPHADWLCAVPHTCPHSPAPEWHVWYQQPHYQPPQGSSHFKAESALAVTLVCVDSASSLPLTRLTVAAGSDDGR